jgi:uncharacterized protein YhjY with autotransporter beta-barrel domain
MIDENGTRPAQTKASQTVGHHRLVGVSAAALLIVAASAAQGQTPTDPPTQDQQLRTLLALGDATGCYRLLGVEANGDAVDARLIDLGQQIGNELRAICGSSAVNSASSLGGGLNTLQATKTVSQFRLVRRRIDQRLQQPPPSKPTGPSRALRQGQPIAPALTYEGPFEGSGLFGEIEYENRDRVDTPYESGYESTVRGFSVGLDHVWGSVVAGGWISFAGVDADLTSTGVLVGSPFPGADDEAFRQLVNDPTVLGSVCGGAQSRGTLEQHATRVGGFAGRKLGRGGFVDVNISWSRRDHDYDRSVCAIENQGQAAFAPNVVFNDLNANGQADPGEVQVAQGRGLLFSDGDVNGTLDAGESVFDDIFAGALTGSARLNEIAFSARTGGDFGGGGWTIGPRAILTYARVTTGAFTEAGRSTVANSVLSNSGLVVRRTLGGPIGLELAYDEASRYSLLLETGGELSYQFGTRVAIVPLAAAYWRHEFNDVRDIVTARLAQDLRPSPTRFSFGTNAPDPNTALVSIGANVLAGERFAARAEWRRLVGDDLFTASGVSVQARVRF